MRGRWENCRGFRGKAQDDRREGPDCCLFTTPFNVYEMTPGTSEWVLVASAVPTGWTKSLSAGSVEWTYQVRGLAADGTTEGPMRNSTVQGV